MKSLFKLLIILILIICVLAGIIVYRFVVIKPGVPTVTLVSPQPSARDPAESMLIEPPSGFEPAPESVAPSGTTVEDIGVIDKGFAFVGADNIEFVTGYTFLFSDEVEMAGFNLELRRPDVLLDLIITAIKASGIEGQEEIPGLDNIGDSSVGVTLVTNWNDAPLRVDGVIFRRNDIGAVAAVVYVDGKQPSVAVGDVAHQIDERLRSDN